MISIIVGSDSDLKVMENTENILNHFAVNYEIKILSAHRSPKALRKYLETLKADFIIAAAGLAAHLPGVIAAETDIPVIGVPIPAGHLQGLDSLLSIVQMPGSIPVATMGIGSAGAKNAALFAVQVLAQKDPSLKAKWKAYRENLEKEILEKNEKLQNLKDKKN